MKKYVSAFLLFLCSVALGEQRFYDLVGPVTVGNVADTPSIMLPCITWGGEAGLFVANGLSLETKPDSIFGKMGLKFKIVKNDNPIEQTRDYMSGKTPFWRGTFQMAGIAAETFAQDPRTMGVVAMQMTWSAGDHIVATKEVKTISDLKGTTGCIQQNGPHVGLVDDVLRTAGLTWDDIKVVWLPELTASPDSPPENFRANRCQWTTVITPDMAGITGGLQNVGSGAEGTVKGSHVLVSTAELSRSIPDVYIVRADFKQKHPEIVDKFVAGYLKGCEVVTDWKKLYETKGSKEYIELLKMIQEVFGSATIPTLEDAHGLISDCRFVGHPGNVAFFEDPKNLSGFAAFNEAIQTLAVSRGYVKNRIPLLSPKFDYSSIATTGALTKTSVKKVERFDGEAVQKEIESFSQGSLDDRTVYVFTITFGENSTDWDASKYEEHIDKAARMAAKFGNGVIGLRAHADPTLTLSKFVKAGMNKGILKRTGSPGNFSYTLNGRPFDISHTTDIVRQIESGAFDGDSENNPREIMQNALNLSRRRADAVQDVIFKYAQKHDIPLDKSQFQPFGVGIREPFIPVPRNPDEANKNMRVEFRIIRVDAEAKLGSDFDF